jgi:hypothetical protein
MASEWLPALFGVIGTLLGGSVTLAANWLQSNTQRQLAAEDHIQQNAGIRREAYALYLTSASMLKDRGRELANTVVAGKSEEAKIESLHKAYYESWEDMKTKRPLVLVAGPDDASSSANNLHWALIEYSDVCDKIYADRAEYRKNPGGWPRKYDKTAEEVDNQFIEFTKQAQRFAMASEPDVTAKPKAGHRRAMLGRS